MSRLPRLSPRASVGSHMRAGSQCFSFYGFEHTACIPYGSNVVVLQCGACACVSILAATSVPA